MELMQANQQWMSRPADERFTSLPEMQAAMQRIREQSLAKKVRSQAIELRPMEDDGQHKALSVFVPGLREHPEEGYAPSHWAFSRLAQLAGAPAGYLRDLPAPLVADCVNYGMRFNREIEDVGLLLYSNGTDQLRAATGPNYGRIWNEEIVTGLVRTIGDGVTGAWKVPGEFGKAVQVTKDNTTLFAGDRDMFVFLADEEHKIEVPDRRDGKSGLMSRGFFVWNSEVGSTSFGISTFLFDYVCCNRIVWGATDVKQIRMRHSSNAPARFLQEIQPALKTYANNSTANLLADIETAKKARIKTDVDEWLAKRYTKSMAASLQTIHQLEEQRPIETLWDVSTALTAKARSIQWQDERVKVERMAGDVLDLAIK